MAEDPSTWPTGRLFSHVARGLEREWNAHLDAWDLNHASLPVLLALLAGDHSQRELAAASGVTQQTMSRILERLERLGYVSRGSDAQDARRRAVHLTDAGRTAALAAARPEVGDRIAHDALTPAQVAQLREILLAMVQAEGDGQ
ncbi:transcriptional regulator, MarR family [Sanguibacter gelidistatuariae]|uniref:Transcriptional regulator, MarR family n=1 Tax=Sanguibacter gelidistatuariae TaxID=1814289 RepID=A0A1G6R7G9_9MICO|nr:MarR family winged helix-turn-helix transcriptional regulator [Sanguibacter gelidistatuariae]SDD00582.1 transcriptional regulator, MarR family [Sanguibacter gelidistatuariae]